MKDGREGGREAGRKGRRKGGREGGREGGKRQDICNTAVSFTGALTMPFYFLWLPLLAAIGHGMERSSWSLPFL
jgi:hypothetical protein